MNINKKWTSQQVFHSVISFSLRSGVFIVLWTYFTHFYGVFIVDFEQVNVSWAILFCMLFVSIYCKNIGEWWWCILINPSHPDPWQRENIYLHFYFHTSLWCVKRFYEGLKDLHKTFLRTTKKCENKDLSSFLF